MTLINSLIAPDAPEGSDGQVQVYDDGNFKGVGELTVTTDLISVSETAQISFGQALGTKISLWGDGQYSIGMQGGTIYNRSGGNFAWFQGGSHNNGSLNPGGGQVRMVLTNQGDLGIGFTAPDASLAVNGGAHIGGTSDPGDNNLHVDGTLRVDGSSVIFSNLPTSDPLVAGQLWNNNGTLAISAG